MPFDPSKLADVGYENTEQTAPPTTEEQVPASGFDPSKLAAVGYKHPTPQVPMPPAAGPSLQDHAAGFGLGVLGEGSRLAGNVLSNVGEVTGSDSIKQYGEDRQHNARVLKQMAEGRSEMGALTGDFSADILGTLAMPAAGFFGGAAAGAAFGLATTEGGDTKQILQDMGRNALIGGSISKALDLAAPLAKAAGSKITVPFTNVVKGLGMVLKNTDDFADAAVGTTMRKLGVDIDKANPESIVRAIGSTQRELKQEATNLYNLRDSLAQAKGLMVDKSFVKNLATDLEAGMATGATDEMTKALGTAKRILGTADAPITFEKAAKLRQSLSSSVNDAFTRGEGSLGTELGKIREAFDNDIARAATGSEDVLAAHEAATNFYRGAYAPIKDLDVQKKIATRFTEDQFITNLTRSLGKDAKSTAGFNKLPEDIQSGILGSAIQSIKESATTNGEINLKALSANLTKSMKTNPELYKQTNALQDIQTLANVLAAPPTTRPGFLKGAVGSGIAGGIGFAGGIVPAAATGLIAYTPFLYSAGKLVNNKSAQNLLRTMRGLEAYPDSAMANLVRGKIQTLHKNKLHSIPRNALMLMGVNSSGDEADV